MIRRSVKTLLLSLLLLSAAHLHRARASPEAPDAEGFVKEARPASMGVGQVDESVPAIPLVAGAYGFIWLAVTVFVGSVALRASRLEREAAALRQRVEREKGG